MEEHNELLERLKKDVGFVPEYYEVMATKNPEMFKAFFKFRSEILEKGVLSKKTKQLMAIAIYAATRFDFGLDVHIRQALKAGATEDEIFETLSLVILTAGLPGYIDGINALKSVK